MTDTEQTRAPSTIEPTNGARRQVHPGLLLLLIAGAQLMVVLDAHDREHRAAVDGPTTSTQPDRHDVGASTPTPSRSAACCCSVAGRATSWAAGRCSSSVSALFSLGSLLGGLATTFELLLVGRVIQGIGGAIASPTALSLITTSFDEGRERNRAFAVYAGSVRRPVPRSACSLGGILTEYLDWRWVLFVNVPIGVVLMIGGFFYIHASERLQRPSSTSSAPCCRWPAWSVIVYGFIHVAHTTAGATRRRSRCSPRRSILLGAFVAYEASHADADDADAHLRQPEPVRRLPGDAHRRRGDVRHVLLRDLLRPGRP